MSAQAAARRRRQKADKLRDQKLGTYSKHEPPLCRCSHLRLMHKDELRCLHNPCGCLVYRERTEEDGCCRD